MNDQDTQVETALPQTLNEWRGVHAEIFNDTTREIDVEGARMCAKTTLLLDKEIHYLQKYPGIHSFICRYTDLATRTKLKPRFEAICRIRGLHANRDWDWNDDELCYEFAQGTRMYAFGLKAANQAERYEKIRGQDLSRVYNDQTESTPKDIGEELRGSLRQKGYPHQLTFSPNPVPPNHWLADGRHGGFPEDNSIAGRKYYRLSIDDNAYNLDADDIAAMKRTYPPEHAKHGAMILGRRGVLVIGDAIFENTFNRTTHMRAFVLEPTLPALEGFDFGKHNPVWMVAQRFHAGGLGLWGGMIGEGMFLEDFAQSVNTYREDWLSTARAGVKTCCPPPGANLPNNGTRFTNHQILHANGFPFLSSKEGAHAADIGAALIEQLAGYMRRRNTANQEMFAINADPTRWLKVSRHGVEPWPFCAQAFEAGIVWDEHFRSVGNQTVRQPKNDDWFGNVLRCVQNLEINFCASQPTQAELERAKAKAAARVAQSRFSDFGNRSDGWLAS